LKLKTTKQRGTQWRDALFRAAAYPRCPHLRASMEDRGMAAAAPRLTVTDESRSARLTGRGLLIGQKYGAGDWTERLSFKMKPSILEPGRRIGSSRLCASIMAALCCLAGAPSAAWAQGVVKAKHGDWEMRCETPPGASREQCALIQSVAAEDRPNVTLIVIVLRTADGKSRLLRVIAPLGVLIPSGLGLKIDQADVGRAGFVRCLPNGCVAEVVMEDKLIDQMKTGKSATFIIFQTPEEGIGIPLALAGFKEGLEQLP
jgi:invasion protein IalB